MQEFYSKSMRSVFVTASPLVCMELGPKPLDSDGKGLYKYPISSDTTFMNAFSKVFYLSRR